MNLNTFHQALGEEGVSLLRHGLAVYGLQGHLHLGGRVVMYELSGLSLLPHGMVGVSPRLVG